MDKILKKHNIPGLGVIIMDSRKFLYARACGFRVMPRLPDEDLYTLPVNNQVTLFDYFHVASAYPLVLSIVAGKLVEQGKIGWHTTLISLFGENTSLQKKEKSNVMLNIQPNDQSVLTKDLTLNKLLQQHMQVSANSYPANAFLPFKMLEKASGSKWHQLVQQVIVNDLGLKVYFGWPNQISVDQPWGHNQPYAHIKTYPPQKSNSNSDDRKIFQQSPSHLSMPVRDLAQLVQLHLRGLRGEQRSYLKPKIYQHLYNLIPVQMSGVDDQEEWGKFYSYIRIAPKKNRAVVVLANAGHAAVRRGVAKLLHLRSTNLA